MSFKSFKIASDVQLIKIKQHNVCVGFKKKKKKGFALVEKDPQCHLPQCTAPEMLDVTFE